MVGNRFEFSTIPQALAQMADGVTYTLFVTENDALRLRHLAPSPWYEFTDRIEIDGHKAVRFHNWGLCQAAVARLNAMRRAV